MTAIFSPASRKAMVVTTGHFTKSAIELAKSNKVELWDKSKLKKIIAEINTSSKYIPESLIELGKSNNLEAIDNLKNMIAELQHTVKDTISQLEAEKVSFPIQHTTLEKGSILTNCPLCSAEIKFALDDLPAMNSTVSVSCPKCNVGMMMKLREKDYSCNYCNMSFKTIKEIVEHQKSCKSFKDRLFKCKYCKKEATIDDAEFCELNEKGQVIIACPSCKKSCTLKK